MEIKFPKTDCSYLRCVARSVQKQEQTQELRLPESMPDIGKVLCAWGQPLIRSKEWRGNGMVVSGGVMVWVLYQSEDGSGCQVVDSWLPYQIRWDFPETQHDGTMQVSCSLSGVDARSLSARKLMLRADVSVLGQAMEPAKAELYAPDEENEDVVLLHRKHFMNLPVEAGERSFSLEEELTLPGSVSKPEKLLYYTLQPEILDKKVMMDKAVFRGTALGHLLYRCQDGKLESWDFEIPFSEFTDLEREYESGATLQVIPAVTGLEVELDEAGQVKLKAGMVGQYVVYHPEEMTLVADAYSPSREFTAQTQALQLPAVLDMPRDVLHLEQSTEQIPADAFFTMEQPSLSRMEEGILARVSGMFQTLNINDEGQLQCNHHKCEAHWKLACDENALAELYGHMSGSLKTAGALRQDVAVQAVVIGQKELPMISGLQLGEKLPRDEGRPSLIIVRTENGDLWQLAKKHGATVDAIRKANSLQDAPLPGQMLLIPIT